MEMKTYLFRLVALTFVATWLPGSMNSLTKKSIVMKHYSTRLNQTNLQINREKVNTDANSTLDSFKKQLSLPIPLTFTKINLF